MYTTILQNEYYISKLEALAILKNILTHTHSNKFNLKKMYRIVYSIHLIINPNYFKYNKQKINLYVIKIQKYTHVYRNIIYTICAKNINICKKKNTFMKNTLNIIIKN